MSFAVTSFENVSKSFAKVKALTSVSFQVEPGRVLAILGRNGAGKTTLINLIVGLLGPDQGQVRLLGRQPPYDAITRTRIAFASQRLALFHNLSVRENLQLFASLQGLQGELLQQRISVVSTQLELQQVMHYRIKACSEGMKRRVHLAVALLADAELYLFDEPTAGVDIQSRHSILQVVAELKKQGKAIIYTTHYIEEAEKVCDDVLILERGQVMASGALPDLVKMYGGQSRISYKNSENGEIQYLACEEPASEISKLMQKGFQLLDLTVLPPRLEDVLSNLVQEKVQHA
ncbi:ABC transporter ATP-binding protein [Rheinheimera riviphila]|nr:ABC transporter ATP-binding protein [Rheinheimera riviphila]